jgi:cold shock CspA family protein
MNFQTIISKINTDKVSEEKMFTGYVKFWSHRGYGFVTRDDDHSDIFLHVSQLPDGRDSLAEGTRIEFQPASNIRNGKLCCQAVRIIP